jgi:Mg-chelatase subunit ChlI
MENAYPFSAIVGQQAMKTALLIAAVDPTIGGVLIRGHKGTAKSTTARGFADILPPVTDTKTAGPNFQKQHDQKPRPHEQRPAPFVELPLGATEDRLIGTLHIEKALGEGKREFEPGLLAAAHRGVLYVDEVNLLDDFLVDVLLDVSASGVNVVEREGISTRHPAEFILLGTMNPEEGELRPQFLDRFGLCVTVEGIRDPDQRLRIAKRRVEFEADRAAFRTRYQERDAVVTEAIAAGRARLHDVAVPENVWHRAVQLAVAVGSEGHRADIVLVKTARALAAFTECDEVDPSHLREAATYVFPHRMARDVIDTPETAREKLQKILAEAAPSPNAESHRQDIHHRHSSSTPDSDGSLSDEGAQWDPLEAGEQIQVPGAAAAGSLVFDYLKKKLPRRTSNPTRQ